MRSLGDSRIQGKGGRVILATGNPAASPLHQALDLGLDWAGRTKRPVAILILHLSRLHAPGPRPHHRRIASALLDGAIQTHGGQVFHCGNGDFVLLTDPATSAALVPTLSHLFRPEAPGVDRLLTLWSLPTDEDAARAHLTSAAPSAAVMEDVPVPLGALAAAEAVLASVPVDELVRRQTAVRITARGMEPLYQELSVSLAALEARNGAPLPVIADPYLFRHLAARLDERVLHAAAGTHLATVPAIHLNLTISSVLSAEFMRFAAGRDATTRLGIELQFMEAVADLPRFSLACDRLRDTGCSLVLDGLDHAVLSLARPAHWQPALLKLDWSPRMATLPARERRLLTAALTAFGPERIVLHRAETEAALAWGRSHGIRRFQGRHVDAMLAAERITACRHAAACTLRQCIGRAAATGPGGRAGCRNTDLLDAFQPRAAAALAT